MLAYGRGGHLGRHPSGAVGSDSTDRNEWLRKGLPNDRPGIEFGPLDRPILTRPGYQVLYADHLDRNGLREKYALHAPVDVDAIPDIDFVLGKHDFRGTFGDGRLHYALASHVIEHVPNPIAWLRDIHDAFVDGGDLLLAIPDMRRCFDALRQPSTAAEWVGAYLEKHSKPSSTRIFDALANEVTVNGNITWAHDADPRDMILSRCPTKAYELAESVMKNGEYMDVHCWAFTPASFCNLLRAAVSAGLISLRLERMTDTLGHEFLVHLRRDDSSDLSDIVASYPAADGRYELLPPDFDARAYYRLNPDIRAARMDPYDHYLQYGWREGRSFR